MSMIKKSIACILQIALSTSLFLIPTRNSEAAATTIFLTNTAATSWTVPSDWNSSNNTIEVIGGGAGGSLGLLAPEFYSVGGGGGAYSKVTNVSLTGGVSVGIQVGDGGTAGSNGEDTWLCSSTSNCASIGGSAVVVGAKAGVLTSTGGTGGAAASGVGDVKYSGGNGAIAAATFAGAGGGGGAAGPNGNGGDGGLGSATNADGGGGGGNGGGYDGADSTGGNAGAGGNNYSNTGGGSAGADFGNAGDGTAGAGGGGGDYIGLSSGDGGNGQDWDATHGSGGGGGGGPGANQTDPYDKNYGGKGGLYGGGGGGSPMGTVNTGDFAGGQGIIVITYTPASGRTTLSKPLNNLGLLAYYPMNEGSGTVPGDFSGNGRIGTFENTPTWVNGKRGKALSFNGTSQSVYLAGSVGNFSISSGGGMTVSAWVRTSDDNGAVVSFRNGLNGSPVLDLSIGFNGITTNAGHFLPLMRYDAGDGLVDVTATKRIDDGLWHHVVAVVDQSNNLLKAYVDGVEYTTTQNTDGVLTFGNDEIAISVEKNWANNAVGSNDQQYLEGVIDEMRVYSRALSVTEIQGLYTSGAVVVGGTEKVAVKTGLVGHWTFNGNDVVWSSASVGTAYDRVGGNNGTLTNMNQTTSPVQGKLGQAFSFSGSGSNYVDVGSVGDAQISSQVSVSAWVYRKANSAEYSELVADELYGSSQGYYLGDFLSGISDSEYGFRINGAGGNAATVLESSMTFNEWVHYVGVFDGDNIYLYKNGVLVDSDNHPDSAVSIDSGNAFVGTGVNGHIDDARVYNRALSESEVKQLYRVGAGTLIRPN